MPDKKRGGGAPVSAQGHGEEATLIGRLDIAFDLETLFETSDQLGDLIVRRRARDEQDARAFAQSWHQQRHAIQQIVEGLDRYLQHAEEQRRLTDERFRALGVAA